MGLDFKKLKKAGKRIEGAAKQVGKEVERVAKQVGNEADRFLGLVHYKATSFGDRLEGLNNEAPDQEHGPVAAAAEAAPAVVFTALAVVDVAAQPQNQEEQQPPVGIIDPPQNQEEQQNEPHKITFHLV
jgi:hypothetical protein